MKGLSPSDDDSRVECPAAFLGRRQVGWRQLLDAFELHCENSRERRFVARSARNGTPFLRTVFYLKPFWTIFPSNPAESARITIFESANIVTFVRAESACIETGLKTRFRADSGRLGLGCHLD